MCIIQQIGVFIYGCGIAGPPVAQILQPRAHIENPYLEQGLALPSTVPQFPRFVVPGTDSYVVCERRPTVQKCAERRTQEWCERVLPLAIAEWRSKCGK